MDPKVQNIKHKLTKTFENVIVQSIGSNRKIPILPKPPLLDEPKQIESASSTTACTSDCAQNGLIKVSSSELQLPKRPKINLDSTNTIKVSGDLTKLQQIDVQGLLAINSTNGSNTNGQNLIKILPKLPTKPMQRSCTGNLLVQCPNNKIVSLQIKTPNILPASVPTLSQVPITLGGNCSVTNLNKNMQIISNKTTTSTTSFTPTPTSNVIKTFQPAAILYSGQTQPFVTDSNESQHLDEVCSVSSSVPKLQNTKSIINKAQTVQTMSLTNGPAATQLKINENVVITSSSNPTKTILSVVQNKSDTTPTFLNKPQASNSINIVNPVHTNMSSNNSSHSNSNSQSLISGDTAISMNSESVGTSAKKILLPIGKIPSNITICKTNVYSKNNAIEEPPPSISLIEKRTSLSNKTQPVPSIRIHSPNFYTNKKTIQSVTVKSDLKKSFDKLNANKDLKFKMSKINEKNKKPTMNSVASSNKTDENITIITQFIPEQTVSSSSMSRIDSDTNLQVHKEATSERKIKSIMSPDSSVENANIKLQILPKASLDNLKLEEKIINSTHSNDDANKYLENTKKKLETSSSSDDSSINETNQVKLNLSKKSLINIEEAEIQRSKNFQKIIKVIGISNKGKNFRQQSLLKNKNIELLKKSPRTLSRSKSLSCRNTKRRKTYRRLSTSSENQIKNLERKEKSTKEILINQTELLKLKVVDRGDKTPQSSSEKLNQALLCEEKIETSPTVSGDLNNSENKKSSEISNDSIDKLSVDLNERFATQKNRVIQSVVNVAEQQLLHQQQISQINKNKVEAENGRNPVFLEQIISNIKPNTPAQNAIQINELANILKWRTGIGLTKDATMAFRINELGLLEIFEKHVDRNRFDIAYEKPIYQRNRQSHKTEGNTEPIYFCKGCNCHGAAVDFLAPDYCSHDCITRYEKKKVSKPASLQQMYISQQRQKKLRKQKMSALLNDSPISLLNNNIKTKREFSWSTYLGTSNTSPAPIDLFLNPFPCGPNLFQVGMKLEAIDPEYSSLFCVCSVVEIKGYRLKMHFDRYSNTYDFWINADSMDIFPPGWCAKTNRILQAPRYMNTLTFNWSNYLMKTKTIPAPRNLFTHLNSSSNTNPFKVGVRFEADDLRNTRKVCVASVADVLDNRILVHFDGWDDRYDYWVDCNSPYIHPVHWHLQNNFEIVPPPDWTGVFDWGTYLNTINGTPATEDYFQTREPISFKVGMKLEIVDKKNPSLIRPGTVIMTDGYEIKVLFDGWPTDYSFWVVDDSPDIHPVGWCDATGHELESPPGFDGLPSIMPCPVVGCRGIGNANRFDIDFHATEESCPYLLANWKREIEKPERANYSDLNVRDNNECQKRKNSDLHNSDKSVKCKKYESGDDNSNNCENESQKIDKRNDDRQIKLNRNNKIFEMKKEFRDDDEFLENNLKLQLTKQLLCDYGPRLDQNYKLWLKHAELITEKMEKVNKNPLHWRVEEVVNFIKRIPQCKDVGEIFRKEDIDGEALLSLRQKDLTDILKLKLGISIKIYNVIILLRAEVISRFS